jgi:hypothetical protein
VTTDAQRAANRANAQNSTGPRSGEGKARSALNAMRHGGYARADTITSSVLGENAGEVEAMIDAIVTELDPVTSMELIAAHQVAARVLNQIRVDRLIAPLAEGTVHDTGTRVLDDSATFWHRYGTDLAIVLDALDGADVPVDFDWYWLVQRIDILERPGDPIEIVQTWPDGTTRAPESTEEWLATTSAAIHRRFAGLDDARDRVDEMDGYRDHALAEQRAERAAQAQQMLEQFERAAQLGDRVDRRAARALEGYHELRDRRLQAEAVAAQE